MKKNFFEISTKIIFIGILVYILYRSEIVWLGEQRNFYSKYFILFLIINIIIFVYYKFSEARKRIFRINFYLILFIIYFFEFSLNFVNLNKKNSIHYNKYLFMMVEHFYLYIFPHFYLKSYHLMLFLVLLMENILLNLH